MKITDIQPQRHNPERVNVYLDGRFAFGLASVEALRLRIGQELSSDEVAQLQEADTYHQAHEKALAYLSHRARSSAEMRRYLAGKEFREQVVEETIARLVEVGLLDDEAFARSWAENRGRFRPKGRQALRQELRQKGIDRETIERTLDDAADDEGELAYRAARQKLSRFVPLEDRTVFNQKVGSYLVRRGFPWSAVREATDRLWRLCEAHRQGEPHDDDE